MVLLIVAGSVCLLGGIIFLSGRENINKFNTSFTNFFNKVMVKSDDFFIEKRVGTGISLLLAGLFCLLMAYWVKKMAPPNFHIF
jgi:hypothetical protein